MTALLRCMDSFRAAEKDGPGRMVLAGAYVRADDPVVKGREHLFVDADVFAETAPVEAATAAPGERRSTTRTKTSKAKA